MLKILKRGVKALLGAASHGRWILGCAGVLWTVLHTYIVCLTIVRIPKYDHTLTLIITAFPIIAGSRSFIF